MHHALPWAVHHPTQLCCKPHRDINCSWQLTLHMQGFWPKLPVSMHLTACRCPRRSTASRGEPPSRQPNSSRLLKMAPLDPMIPGPPSQANTASPSRGATRVWAPQATPLEAPRYLSGLHSSAFMCVDKQDRSNAGQHGAFLGPHPFDVAFFSLLSCICVRCMPVQEPSSCDALACSHAVCHLYCLSVRYMLERLCMSLVRDAMQVYFLLQSCWLPFLAISCLAHAAA